METMSYGWTLPAQLFMSSHRTVSSWDKLSLLLSLSLEAFFCAALLLGWEGMLALVVPMQLEPELAKSRRFGKGAPIGKFGTSRLG